MTSSPAEQTFLLLDQAPAEEEKPAGRPWAKCTCRHRIWSERALRLGKGSKCGRGLHLAQHGRGRGGRSRAWRFMTGQTDLFTSSKETSMVPIANIATVFVADTLDESGIDVTTRYGQDERPEVTVTLGGQTFRLHLTQLPDKPDAN